MIRGVAALAVAAEHIRGLFFASFSTVQRPTLPVKAFYAATALGHQAVVVFFVLSGFLIGQSVLRSWNAGQWSWRVYLVSRGARLYIVLIPALLITAVADLIGSHTSQGGWVYRTVLGNFGAAPFAASYTVRAFVGSAVFLNTIITPCFGSNGPLWSLANEFWYYILFPMLLCAAGPRAAVRQRLLHGCAFLFGLWFVGRSISVYFLIWLMGALIGWSALSKAPLARRIPVVSAGLTAACGLAGWTVGRAVLPDFGLGVAVSILVWLGWSKKDLGVVEAYRWVAVTLAGFSYTLYVVHFPLLVLARACLLPARRWQPSWVSGASGAALCAGALLFAFALSRVTEAKTDSARAFLISWVGPRIRRKPVDPAAETLETSA
jgi:peptidoglycan/LPS O-acetylase OafA/YrhL